jgi:hypothetical protein
MLSNRNIAIMFEFCEKKTSILLKRAMFRNSRNQLIKIKNLILLKIRTFVCNKYCNKLSKSLLQICNGRR